jgi:uncharacterized membrane protein
MNILFLVALAVVIIVYVLISRKETKEAIKKTTPKEDAGKFFHHFSQTLIYLFILMIWGLRWIFGIFKVFINWYKSKPKKEEEKKPNKQPKGTLWCPRCQKFFKKDHACFKGG